MSNDIKDHRKLTKEELMQLENYDPEYKVDALIAPCKDCPTRYLGCHDKCYKYQAFRQARDEYNEIARKEREAASNNYFCNLSSPCYRSPLGKRKSKCRK